MSRSFAKASLADAVGRLRPGMKVLLPPGCGDPSRARRRDPAPGGPAGAADPHGRPPPRRLSVRRARLRGQDPLRDVAHVAAAPRRGRRAATWTSCPRATSTRVSLFAAGGPWAPDAVLVHTAPPDAAGYLSLGVSVSYSLPAARRAPLVIAQVNPRMPRTLGNAFLHRSQIDCWAEVDAAAARVPADAGRATSSGASPRHVADLVPDGATIQVGVGSIPQAVMEALGGKRDLGVHSLLVEHMLPLVEQRRDHQLRASACIPGRMDVGEIMGTARLFDWAHDNPRVNMEPSDIAPRPAGGGGARRLRVGELGARGGSARPGQRRERGRPADDRHRRAVRLRAGREPRGRAAGRSSRCRRRAAAGTVSRIVRAPARGRARDDAALPHGLRGDRARGGGAARDKATPGGRGS